MTLHTRLTSLSPPKESVRTCSAQLISLKMRVLTCAEMYLFQLLWKLNHGRQCCGVSAGCCTAIASVGEKMHAAEKLPRFRFSPTYGTRAMLRHKHDAEA